MCTENPLLNLKTKLPGISIVCSVRKTIDSIWNYQLVNAGLALNSTVEVHAIANSIYSHIHYTLSFIRCWCILLLQKKKKEKKKCRCNTTYSNEGDDVRRTNRSISIFIMLLGLQYCVAWLVSQHSAGRAVRTSWRPRWSICNRRTEELFKFAVSGLLATQEKLNAFRHIAELGCCIATEYNNMCAPVWIYLYGNVVTVCHADSMVGLWGWRKSNIYWIPLEEICGKRMH